MRRKINGSRILLTGASSGIGRALADIFVQKGAELVVTARRGELLDQIVAQHPDCKIVPVVGDITDPVVRERCVDTAVRELGGIDLLVNNAGVGATAPVESTPEDILRRMMEVNYFSLILLTRLAVPHLRDAAKDAERFKAGMRPMIVNLSSIVGLRGVPHYGAYGAAKFAVTGISESLRAELFRDNIEVLQVSPGTTQTEFFDSLLVADSTPDMPVHHAVSAEYVAGRIVRAMERVTPKPLSWCFCNASPPHSSMRSCTGSPERSEGVPVLNIS